MRGAALRQQQTNKPAHQRPGRHCRRAATCAVVASLHARWCLDARYGCKQEVTNLLQEWVQTVGRSAGLGPSNTRLSSGSIGVPESRLEMEVTFDSMAEFETFLASIPFQQHKAWTQRIQSMVVDGSPVWQVHRAIPLSVSTTPEAAAARETAPPSSSRSSIAATASSPSQQLVFTDQISSQDMAAWEQLKRDSSSGNSSPVPPSSPPPGQQAPGAGDEAAADAPVQRDWKGDPIKFNPGDRLPFKFL